MDQSAKRVAVVLFNLGGPDSPDAVQPFLFNLFNDPAIIGAPAPLRWSLAQFISRRRAPVAREIYAELGGRSPLLENTKAQAVALQRKLSDLGDVRCFVAMRYWHPFAAEAARDVKAFEADATVLLPLYPQFSTTTTGSSLTDWYRAASAAGLAEAGRAVCCYPDNGGFVEAMAERVAERWKACSKKGRPRILFSAHGLPKRTVARGDPYQWQVELSAQAIAKAVTHRLGQAPDWLVSYQSRVGPLEWIGPYTDAEIERAGRDGVPLVVAPVAFVSEHSETLVELDIEYRRLAEEHGVPAYERVPTVGDAEQFIAGLAGLVRAAMATDASPASGCGARICPAETSQCAMADASLGPVPREVRRS